MPAIRNYQEEDFVYPTDCQRDGEIQTIHLDSAQAEFSLRKRLSSSAATASRPSSAIRSPSVSSQTRALVRSTASSLHSVPKPKKKKASNAFILYRSDVLSRGLLPKSVTHQNTASVMIAERWRAEPDEVKRKYYEMAAAKKRIEDEAYARECGIPNVPVTVPKRIRKVRTRGVIPVPRSYPQFVCATVEAPQIPALQALPEFSYPEPEHDTLPDLSYGNSAFSPSSSAESCSPPTPALPGDALSNNPLELLNVPSSSDNSSTDLDVNVPGTYELEALLKELFPIPDIEFHKLIDSVVPNDPVFQLRIPSPISEATTPSMPVADSEEVSWARVRAYIDTHPGVVLPGLGFSVSLLDEDSLVPQFPFSESTLTTFDSCTLANTQKVSAKSMHRKAPQGRRRLAIPPGCSAGWSDAFKEFASGNNW